MVLPFKILLTLAVSVVLALVLVLLLHLTDLALTLWDRLQDVSPLFWVAYLGGIALLAGGGRYLIRRLRSPRPSSPVSPRRLPPNEIELLARLNRGEAAGAPVAAARQELTELFRRRSHGEVIVAVFGEINTGKSSLIRALLPGAELSIGPRGGTTREIRYHTWTSPAGDRLVLADLPGLNEADGQCDALAREEAVRAHLVLHVCDGDLTRDQWRELEALRDLQKPLLLVLNKSDRYRDDELTLIRDRLRQRLGDSVDVVAVQSGGTEQVTRLYPDGREETVLRERPPQVEALRQALQRQLDHDPRAMEQLRDAAVFVLTQQKLDAALAMQRREQANALVEGYARKAVFGALAAVGPGTDVLIQGYLGVSMLRELCGLYEIPARDIELQRFLSLAGDQVRRTLNLLLALAGNVFKAFPGVGTVIGGMLHAVVYGLVFESLGRAVVRSLESRGELSDGPALRLFEDELHENLETRAARFARLVLARRGERAH